MSVKEAMTFRFPLLHPSLVLLIGVMVLISGCSDALMLRGSSAGDEVDAPDYQGGDPLDGAATETDATDSGESSGESSDLDIHFRKVIQVFARR